MPFSLGSHCLNAKQSQVLILAVYHRQCRLKQRFVADYSCQVSRRSFPVSQEEQVVLATETMPKESHGPVAHATWQRRFQALRELLFSAQVPVTVAVSLVVFGLQAIHSILLSRLLGPTGRGEYGTAIFYAQTMIYIGLLGTHYSIARRATEQLEAPSLLQRSAFRSGLMTGLFAMAVTIVLSMIGLPESKRHILPLCFVCALLLPAEHLRLAAQAVDHGRGKFNRYNLSRLFAAAVFPVLVLGLYLADYNNLTTIAWFTVLVPVVGYIFYWLISDTKNVFGNSSPKATQLIRAGLPDGKLVFANDLFDRLAMLLVVWIVSMADQGLFLTALPIASLLLVAPNAFELFAFRAAVSSDDKLTTSKMLRSTFAIVGVQLAILLTLQLALEPLVRILLTDRFIDAVPVARVLICGMALSGLTIAGEGYLRGRKLTKVAIYCRVISIIVMLGSVFALLSWSPLMRVAYATVAGHGINALLVGAVCLSDTFSKTSALNEERE